MEMIPHWSNFTLIIYLSLAITIMYLINIGIKNKYKKIKIFKYEIKYLWIIYVILLTILLLFCSFRSVDDHIGGTDSLFYIEAFENAQYIPFDLSKILKLEGLEPIFYNFLFLISSITKNRYIFFNIIYITMYGFIIKFVFDNSDEKIGLSYMLLFLPYLYGYNLMRNMLAISIALLAINYLKKGKQFLFIILALISFLTHYSLIVFVGVGIYYKFFLEKFIKKRKNNNILITISILVSLVAYPVFKTFFATSGFNGYLNKNISLLGYTQVILLFILTQIFYKDLSQDNEKDNWLCYSLFMFNLMILPISILLGAGNRMLITFMVPRIVLWVKIESIFVNKFFKEKRAIVQIIIFILLILWIIFRIYNSWQGNGFMPYYNDIINLILGW